MAGLSGSSSDRACHQRARVRRSDGAWSRRCGPLFRGVPFVSAVHRSSRYGEPRMIGVDNGARRELEAPSPSQRFRDIQEQRPQVIDDGLLALHFAPNRWVGHGHDCIAQIPEFCLACAIVSNAAVLEETSSIRAVGFATDFEQNVAVGVRSVSLRRSPRRCSPAPESGTLPCVPTRPNCRFCVQSVRPIRTRSRSLPGASAASPDVRRGRWTDPSGRAPGRARRWTFRSRCPREERAIRPPRFASERIRAFVSNVRSRSSVAERAFLSLGSLGGTLARTLPACNLASTSGGERQT